MENYFIIHGSFSSLYSNWIGWLYDFIEDEGKQVYVPDFPIGVGYQTYENWSRSVSYTHLVLIELCLLEEKIMVLIDLNAPKITWTSEYTMMKENVNVMYEFFYAVIVIILLALTIFVFRNTTVSVSYTHLNGLYYIVPTALWILQ